MRKIIFCTIFIFSVSVKADFTNLQKGIIKTEENRYELTQTKSDLAYAYGTAQITHKAKGDRGVVSFLRVESTYELFSLSRSNNLYLTNIENDQILGHWPLTPYPSHLFLSGEYIAAYEAVAGVHGDTADAPADPSVPVLDRPVVYLYDVHQPSYHQEGCLQHTPLRYGDVDADGKAELVLFLDNNLILFSPQPGQVMFSAHYWLEDELTAEEAVRYFPGTRKDTDPQYIAGSGTDVLVNEIFSAKRSISKLYFGDFNADQQPDILLWRKLYQSRLRNDPIQGFTKEGENWVHYSLQNGEYKLQTTEASVIKDWLTAKQLSWQKGYPSASECPGQEGQLIPEMHDPLLNDADVLK